MSTIVYGQASPAFMRKVLRIFLWSVAILLLAAAMLLTGFIYKVKYGFPVTSEREVPHIDFPADKKTRVLLFSKATGFRHDASIEAGKRVMRSLAEKHGWFLYATDSGGVFQNGVMKEFSVIVFNNCTGRLLDEDQQLALENFVNGGGKFIGIHGAGDDSHHWPWYEQNLIGVQFSHFPVTPQFQQATVLLNQIRDSTLTAGLPESWDHSDEWYVFTEQPSTRGYSVLFNIDGRRINPNGNVLWITGKDFGMGESHPVAWSKKIGEGSTFYTSMGHEAKTWEQPVFVQMITNAVEAK